MDKREIRNELSCKRKKLLKKIVKEKSSKIISKLKRDKDFINAKKVMFYLSIDNEVFTHKLVKEFIGKKKVIVPKVIGTKLLCVEIDKWENLEKGKYGILEPSIGKLINPKEIDLIIVPGVGFDKLGGRIGRGYAFYDRLLKGSKSTKVGLCYKFQILDIIPMESWDIKVDKIICD